MMTDKALEAAVDAVQKNCGYKKTTCVTIAEAAIAAYEAEQERAAAMNIVIEAAYTGMHLFKPELRIGITDAIAKLRGDT